jgi:hypothetical protein
MSSDEFRKLALEIPTAVERLHMHHPDFRVAGRIFASLGVPYKNWGMVKLTPEEQRAFIKKAPEIFKPCSGTLGASGLHECLSFFRENERCARCSQRCGKGCRTGEEENGVARASRVPSERVLAIRNFSSEWQRSRVANLTEECLDATPMPAQGTRALPQRGGKK